jgi:hypothetical protein
VRNIFLTLERYTSSPENFLTEAFVYILNCLLETDRTALLEFLGKMCSDDSELEFKPDEDISIQTQEYLEGGTPDIRIAAPDKYIYIEVKRDSQLGQDQIGRYKRALEKRKESIKKLILLTRFSMSLENQESPDKQVRWYEIYNWLLELRPMIASQLGSFLVRSFLSYLEESKMTIQKVGWEYANGMVSFRNLIDMIKVSLEAMPIKISRYSAAWEWMGFYFDRNKYFCGIYYDKPLTIIIEKYPTPKTKVAIGSYNLESEHFFCADKDSQIKKIKSFVAEILRSTELKEA